MEENPYQLKHPVRVLGVPYHEITDELLQRKFYEYNHLYFNGELGKCRFRFDSIYMHGAWGTYRCLPSAIYHFNIHYPIITLDILLTYNQDYWIRGVILHEMIHMYLDTVLHIREKRMHGPVFQRVRRFLNKTYHLEIDKYEHSQEIKGYDIYKNDMEGSTILSCPIDIEPKRTKKKMKK